jgi:hypothetical protein
MSEPSMLHKRTLAPLLAATLVAAALGLGLAGNASAATWCGTPGSADRLPQVGAGYSVHFVYAIPSDGVDRLAERASRMQTDAESIDAWWRREDPTRAPRFDTYPFPCAPQLDITVLRLSSSDGDTEPIDVRADRILAGLSSTGLSSSPYQKLVVYYDGADRQGSQKICGQGGRNFAFVYVNACTDVPTDDVVAHELMHALGAVPGAAPHQCPRPNSGHTCDTAADIMYWQADGQNVFAHLLDPGRDDYYGHAGAWFDVQDSPWLTHLDAQAQLSLTFSGQGTVTSDIPGVQCSAACTSQWDTGTQVTLKAAPATGQRFVSWSGGCTGSAACVVKVGEVGAVGAVFGPAAFGLKVSLRGKGRVRSTPSALNCPARCAGQVSAGVSAVLLALPTKGWRFSRWYGACRGTSARCLVPMKGDRSARAVFVRITKKTKPTLVS